jgi:hypothetical protein
MGVAPDERRQVDFGRTAKRQGCSCEHQRLTFDARGDPLAGRPLTEGSGGRPVGEVTVGLIACLPGWPWKE